MIEKGPATYCFLDKGWKCCILPFVENFQLLLLQVATLKIIAFQNYGVLGQNFCYKTSVSKESSAPLYGTVWAGWDSAVPVLLLFSI